MKKRIFNLLMLFALTGIATAQTVTVTDVEALPGETVKATINFTAPANKYTGVQFSVQFPATGFANVTKGALTGFSLCEVGGMTAGKVNVAATAADFFETASIELQFDVDNALALGDYDVTITNIQFEATGVEDKIANVPFKVTVTDRITLDENSTTAPMARTGVNVTVKRTIKAGEWSTICLPFAMNKDQADAAFGSDAIIKQYTNYTADIDENTLIPQAITLNFSTYALNALKKINAGVPYLIKTTRDITSFNVDGVTISATADDVSGKETNYDLAGKFKGVLAKTKVPDKGLFISGNKFYYSTGNTNIMAFRGWFELAAILNEEVATSRICFNFDEATGIQKVNGNSVNMEDTYDLQGRRVTKALKKGLYIKNGKKTVIK